MNLDSHLCNHAAFAGFFGKSTNLVQVMCQRFLTIDVFIHFYRRHGSHCVCVVRCRYCHCVDILMLSFEHPAKILVRLGVGMSLEAGGPAFVVHIAQRDDINDLLPADPLDIGPSHAADADTGDIELVTRRRMFRTAEHVTARWRFERTRQRSRHQTPNFRFHSGFRSIRFMTYFKMQFEQDLPSRGSNPWWSWPRRTPVGTLPEDHGEGVRGDRLRRCQRVERPSRGGCCQGIESGHSPARRYNAQSVACGINQGRRCAGNGEARHPRYQPWG